MNTDIQDKVEAVEQGAHGRIYRCTSCDERSPVVADGEDLRAWFDGHNCIQRKS